MLWVAALNSVCLFSMLHWVFVAMLLFPCVFSCHASFSFSQHFHISTHPVGSTHSAYIYVYIAVSEISGDLEQWCLILSTLGS